MSRTTLFKVLKNRWATFLKFRDIGQGKRCNTCAALDEERLQATSQEEKDEINKSKHWHIEEIKATRIISMRGNTLATKDAKHPSMDGMDRMMKITVDGMDQAKFRLPRNINASAEFESLWRPQQHVVGCTVQAIWKHTF